VAAGNMTVLLMIDKKGEEEKRRNKKKREGWVTHGGGEQTPDSVCSQLLKGGLARFFGNRKWEKERYREVPKGL
jgi:hypothetical protein